MFILGIDPDVTKSGIARLNVEDKNLVDVRAISFVDLVEYLGSIRQHAGKMVIVIEDSDSTTNWHTEKLVYAPLNIKGKLNKAAAIGHGAGMCHATQRHIQEIAEAYGFTVHLQKPLKKCWKGPDGKITQDEALQFMTGLPGRCNQECRDAALLAWNYANLPIRMPAGFYTQENLKRTALDEFKRRTAEEGEFLLRARGVQPDENGVYRSEDGLYNFMTEKRKAK